MLELKINVDDTIESMWRWDCYTGDTVKDHFARYVLDEEPIIKHFDKIIVATFDSRYVVWPGKHKNVLIWHVVQGNLIMGLNENPSRGITPVYMKAHVTFG